MKKTIVMALVAGLVGAGSLTFANNPEPVKIIAAEANGSEMNITKIQKSFSGLVKRTDVGFILETADGNNYQLKGLSLADTVGKKVDIIGVIKDAQQANIIYVVKADVQK